MAKKTKLKLASIDFLIDDPSWPGDYPIDETPADDYDIGLRDSPDAPLPAPPPSVISQEPDAKPLSPYPDEFGDHARPTKFAYGKDRLQPGVPDAIQVGSFLPEHTLNGRTNSSLLGSFLHNTVDNWLSAPDVDSVGGYIGNVLNTGTGTDNYIQEQTDFDKKNQLQPAIRSFAGTSNDLNMTWHEMLDKMKASGLDTTNIAQFFATSKFSYQPPISPEKFANYRYFYWTKNLGNWDITENPANSHELILVSGDLTDILDLLVGDYVRIKGQEFRVQEFDVTTNTIRVVDESDELWLAPWYDYTDLLVGHDRPSYNVQAASEFLTNGWILNNHWTHLDDLTEAQTLAFVDGVYIKAQLPIIELLKDVKSDPAQTHTKTNAPNVELYPMQYVDINQTAEPVNVGSRQVGFNPTTSTPIFEDAYGDIPVVYKPVLDYMVGEVHGDDEPTEIDPILGIKAVKLDSTGVNYMFRNGLIDVEHGDVRRGRFYIYLTQIGIDNPEVKYTHSQSTASTEWSIPHDLGYIPVIRVFLLSGDEIFPASITATTTEATIRFTYPLPGIASLT